MVLVLEPAAADDAGKLPLDAALAPLVLRQRAPGLVHLEATFAGELAVLRPAACWQKEGNETLLVRIKDVSVTRVWKKCHSLTRE